MKNEEIKHTCGITENFCNGNECECEVGYEKASYYRCEHCCGCGITIEEVKDEKGQISANIKQMDKCDKCKSTQILILADAYRCVDCGEEVKK